MLATLKLTWVVQLRTTFCGACVLYADHRKVTAVLNWVFQQRFSEDFQQGFPLLLHLVLNSGCWLLSSSLGWCSCTTPFAALASCKLSLGVSSAVLNTRVSTKVLRRFSIGLSTGSQQGLQHWFSAGCISTTVWHFLLLAGPGRRPWPFLCCKSSTLLALLYLRA